MFPALAQTRPSCSALERTDTLPPGVVEQGDILFPPRGSDMYDVITGFSNVWTEIALAGPGDGVISTVPGGTLSLSGTSMAAALLASARPLGFGPSFEGHGLR